MNFASLLFSSETKNWPSQDFSLKTVHRWRLHESKKETRAKNLTDFFVPGQLPPPTSFFVAARNQNICLHVFVDRWRRRRLKNAALSQGQSNRIFFGVGTPSWDANERSESGWFLEPVL